MLTCQYLHRWLDQRFTSLLTTHRVFPMPKNKLETQNIWRGSKTPSIALYKNKFKDLIRTSKFKFSFPGLIRNELLQVHLKSIKTIYMYMYLHVSQDDAWI